MNTPVITDESCFAFERVPSNLDPNAVHRFVVGEDPGPRAMTADEMASELGDPLATLLLRNGIFPRTGDELLAAIDAAVPEGDPLRSQMSFLLGEGSQLPGGPDAPGTNRGMRFLVVRGSAPDIDLLMSAGSPTGGLVEVMAWDRVTGGFNYYRTVGDGQAWAFAGNSRHALLPKTAGKGPFESHPTGSLIMKELKFPWLHWHGPPANIFPEAFEPGDDRSSHPWFKDKLGADVLEISVAIPSIDRWTAKRFEGLVGADGSFADPRRVIEQVVTTPTVNLITSNQASGPIGAADVVGLPPTFFVDLDALSELGLAGPPGFSVLGEHYLAALEEFQSALVEERSGFRHPQDESKFADTHFAFAGPERAFEDQSALRAAIGAGLVSPRLAAALLMVDFPNPVFSRRRAALLAHAPEEAPRTQEYSAQMADGILAAAAEVGAGSPEAEFAERWNVGESFVEPHNALLQGYYDALTQRLATREGYLDVARLAESRRRRVRELPIGSEFDLLFATLAPETAPNPLRMTVAAAIEEEA